MLIKINERNLSRIRAKLDQVLQNVQVQHTFLQEVQIDTSLAKTDLLNRIVTCNEQALHFAQELQATLNECIEKF
jgi:hypothetical protein